MNKIAKFYDGELSTAIPVQIDHDMHGVFIKDLDWKTLAYYPCHLVVIEMPADSLPGVIGCMTAPDVRLLIEDSDLFSQIQSKMKKKVKSSHVLFSWITLMLLAVATIIFVILIVKFPYNYSRLIAESIPQSWDDTLGEYAAKAVTKDYVTCNNSSGQKALEKLMKGLVDASGKSISVTIKVFDDDSTMNAFAMSGNQIFVFSGLIKESQDYEELAGVLAHELGHVLKRHPTEGVIHALGLTLLFKLISSGSGQIDYVLNVSNLYLSLHYSRAHETEADDIAIHILTKTGVGVEGFLSTHPLTEDRINHIKEKLLEQSFFNKRIITKTEWAQIKAMCSVVSGNKERAKEKGS